VKARGPDERGQAGIEMLVVLLLLVPLVWGGLRLTQGVGARHALDTATATAARHIALDPGAWESALIRVQAGVDGALLGPVGPVTCQVTAAGVPVVPTGLAFGTPFAVTCSVPFSGQLPFAAAAPRTLTSTQWAILERYP